MGRGRAYSIQFNNVSVAAVQDLIALYCGANMACELHGVVIGQITGTTVQNLRISVKRLPATVTPGSAGSAPTPQKAHARRCRGDGHGARERHRRGDDLRHGGRLHSDVFNTVNGFQFFWPPADMPTIGPSEAAILSLDGAPSGALVMSGTLYFAELF
jgi:hypothetical protein